MKSYPLSDGLQMRTVVGVKLLLDGEEVATHLPATTTLRDLDRAFQWTAGEYHIVISSTYGSTCGGVEPWPRSVYEAAERMLHDAVCMGSLSPAQIAAAEAALEYALGQNRSPELAAVQGAIAALTTAPGQPTTEERQQ